MFILIMWCLIMQFKRKKSTTFSLFLSLSISSVPGSLSYKVWHCSLPRNTCSSLNHVSRSSRQNIITSSLNKKDYVTAIISPLHYHITIHVIPTENIPFHYLILSRSKHSPSSWHVYVNVNARGKRSAFNNDFRLGRPSTLPHSEHTELWWPV